MLRSTADWPNSTSPSAAIRSPGRTTNRCPARRSVTGTRRSVPSSSSTHASLRARRSQLAHRVPGVAPRLGLIQPAGQQERRHRRGDLQVDAATGRVQQQVGKAQPALAVVQDEHRVHRPAARRGDAQRHQGVHRDRAVPGVPQRGGVERPRRPHHHRRRHRDQDPLPAREPRPREQRQQHRQVSQRDEQHQRHDQPPAQVGNHVRVATTLRLAPAGRQQAPRLRRDRGSRRGNRPARPRR